MEKKKNKQKKTIKKLNDRQLLIIIICTTLLIVMGYAARGIYYSYTGAVRSEVVNYVTEAQRISVEGLVVRDEGLSSGKKTNSLLKKSSDGTYSPVVSDGESVAKNQSVAYIFENKENADKFREIEEIKSRLNFLEKLQDSENISYLDLSMLNSEIASSVSYLIDANDKNDLSDLNSRIEDLCYKLTSKQIITGEEINFKSEIKSLTKRKDKLEKELGQKKNVVSPRAGYFVSDVDGYEKLFDYKKIAEEGLTVSEILKMEKKKPESTDEYFGKIISEHAWYFVFVTDFQQASTLKVNSDVSVSFPDKNISDFQMTVTSLKRKDNKIAVVLRCVTMNENMLYLRNERAVITIGTYYGLKISNSALKKYNDELMGVYAYVGNVVLFKPIKIIYSTDKYVIAEPVSSYYDDNESDVSASAPDSSAVGETSSENDGKQEIQIDKNNVLKAYDRIIVKGRNLYDGKVIG